MAGALDWSRDGATWPHHERSRFVQAAGLRWHVQQFPGPQADSPSVLLLHGTGASSHSWRDLAPLLAQRFEVLCRLSAHRLLPAVLVCAGRKPRIASRQNEAVQTSRACIKHSRKA